MNSTSRILAAVTLSTLAVAVAGCGGSDGTPAAAPSSSTTTSSGPSTSTEASTSPGADDSPSADDSAATPEFTKQGTKLKFGEKAIVQVKSGQDAGAIGITAVSIKKGSAADLAALKLGDKGKGFVPYFVTFKVTNEAGTDLSFTSLSGTHGLLGDGSPAQSLIVFGDYKPCASDDAGKAFNTVGSSYTTCTPALAGAGAKVSGANYNANSSEVNTAADTDYFKDPITWN
jgi:fructose-specific component phosphotransferase system IIB-like protein